MRRALSVSAIAAIVAPADPSADGRLGRPAERDRPGRGRRGLPDHHEAGAGTVCSTSAVRRGSAEGRRLPTLGPTRARLLGAALGVAGSLALPAVALGHQLSPTFQSRLPLAVYLSGAGAAVALSFAFVLLRDVRADPPVDRGARWRVPRPLALLLRAIGLVGWAWIAVQTVLGGDSDAEVIRLFTWVYAWVGIALVSALVGPIWRWLDPFSTLYDLFAAGIRAAGLDGAEAAAYPPRLGRWPAAVGFAIVVWLELVADGAGTRTLGILILGYTVFTLAMMAQFGRDPWREKGEIFSVWFALLGRLAPIAAMSDGTVRPRRFASGLLEGGWAVPDLVLIALGTGSILYDGLSQTVPWVQRFGLPGTGVETIELAAFLGIIVAAALAVSRLVGVDATGAGLLPIAIGYLAAHYLTYLLIEGQRIVIAVSDPFQRGWDLFGTASFQPSGAWLVPAAVWTVQLAAVVGGHMLGAWAGHVVASWRAPAADAGDAVPARRAAELRVRQVPLAVVMVGLTTITLWSLGQAIFVAAQQ